MIPEHAINSAKAFDAEHGDFVCQGSYIYFIDGAKRAKNPVGLQIGIPFEQHERLKRVAFFWELKLKLAISKFDHAKTTMVQFAKANAIHGTEGQKLLLKYGPQDTEAAVAELQRLKAVADEISEKYAEAKQAITDTTPQEDKDKREMDQKCRAEWSNYLNELEQIEI